MPYLSFLAAFGLFVVWNGGIVLGKLYFPSPCQYRHSHSLGDKENHIASIHTPQMLYIWPYFMFFSFPLLYPYILNSFAPQSSLPVRFSSGPTRHQLPRAIVAIPIMAMMLLVVHFNTIVHPFTLADNRHYMFYVFRILLRHPIIKYLAVPVYFVCAWAAITALGGLPNKPPISGSQLEGKKDSSHKSPTITPPAQDEPQKGNRVSFVLVWLLATSLPLITAPLVEPRYFIIPWLLWRLHIPNPPPQPSSASSAGTKARRNSSEPLEQIKAALYKEYDLRLWLETAWFLLINWVTGYIFLYKGFEWPQEPGQVQRFMW